MAEKPLWVGGNYFDGTHCKRIRRDASARIGGLLETMREAIIAIFNNHEWMNATTRIPQPQSTRAIRYDTSDDRANEKEKDCLLTFF